MSFAALALQSGQSILWRIKSVSLHKRADNDQNASGCIWGNGGKDWREEYRDEEA